MYSFVPLSPEILQISFQSVIYIHEPYLLQLISFRFFERPLLQLTDEFYYLHQVTLKLMCASTGWKFSQCAFITHKQGPEASL